MSKSSASTRGTGRGLGRSPRGPGLRRWTSYSPSGRSSSSDSKPLRRASNRSTAIWKQPRASPPRRGIPISTSSSVSATAHSCGPAAASGVVLPRSAFAGARVLGLSPLAVRARAAAADRLPAQPGSWAFDMEPRYSVCLLLARHEPAGGDGAVEVAGVADSVRAFAAQVERPGLLLRREALGRLLEVPLLPHQADADLLAKLRVGRPFPFGGGCWRCFALREFHETMTSTCGQGARTGWPLWKGASFDQFEPHGAEARWCPPTAEALARAMKRRAGWRVAARQGNRAARASARRGANAAAGPSRVSRHQPRDRLAHRPRLPRPTQALPHEYGAVPGFRGGRSAF